ncbi:type II toxin-antitoxin system mRNA interferase toxin, RelE/StbE family [Gloeocapsopsis sp. IPPAS B-1203]|nr:type II toxin-antitoxin system mRNA interferase toxin, RelE/StbE family [Gloeocapsopsis sp. IPPAS B-1203]
MIYKVEFSKGALKQFNKLPLEFQERIQTKIDELANNTRPSGVGKLKGGDNRYRIKVGNYRILYEIYDSILLIIAIRIGHRREVYREEKLKLMHYLSGFFPN